MKIFFKKRKKVLAFCKKVLYTNEVGCGKQQKSRANDTNEYGQLVKGFDSRTGYQQKAVRIFILTAFFVIVILHFFLLSLSNVALNIAYKNFVLPVYLFSVFSHILFCFSFSSVL